jgi:EpsI family protein
LVVAYSPTLVSLAHRWSADPDYGHGYLVPLLSAALLVRALGALDERPLGDWFGVTVGSGLLILGIAAHWITALVPSIVLSGWSLVMVLSGLTALLFGWRGRRLVAATIFLIFMVPLPAGLYARLAVPLQWLATRVSAALVEMLGAPAVAEGNLIRLPGQTLHVAAACSGLRQLLAFIALATALVLVIPRPGWMRAVVVVSAGPIAIATNVVRVTLNGLAAWWGFDTSTGSVHTAEGLIVVGAGAAVLLLELRLLDWLAGADSTTTSLGNQPPTVERTSLPTTRGLRFHLAHLPPFRIAFALAVLGLGFGAREILARTWLEETSHAAPSLERMLDGFPNQLGAWTGRDAPLDAQIIRDIKVDAWLQRVYVHPTGERLALWLSGSRRSFDQYHYPTVCMQGAGWTEDRGRRTEIALAGADALPVSVMRMVFHRGGEQQSVYYWYYLVGEATSDRVLRQLHGWSRALLRGRRNASLTVEIFSQSPQPREELLDDFARQTAAALARVLPPGAVAACDLGADY